MPQTHGNGKTFLEGEAEAMAKPSPVPSKSFYKQLASVCRNYIGSWTSARDTGCPARDTGCPVSIYVYLEETVLSNLLLHLSSQTVNLALGYSDSFLWKVSQGQPGPTGHRV